MKFNYPVWMTERLRKDSWNQSLTKMVFLASSERYSPIVISSKYALTDWARMIIQAVRLSFNFWSIVCSYFACSLIKTAVKSLHFCCSDTYQKHYSLNNQWMLGSHKKVSVSCKSFWHPKILFQRWEQCLHDCPLYNPFTLSWWKAPERGCWQQLFVKRSTNSQTASCWEIFMQEKSSLIWKPCC